MALLLSDKEFLNIIREQEGHFIIIKGLMNWEAIIVKIYRHLTKSPKYINIKLTELVEADNSKLTVGNFNPTLNI